MGFELGQRTWAVGRWHQIMMSVAALALGSTAVAAEASSCETVIVGTNDPAIDVPAVQQAVDDGCAKLVLQGKFRFVGMESGDPLRVVTVRRSVSISGQIDGSGHLPQIVGGYVPILVDAPGE